MNINLSGKTAIVCGSTQGIGKAVAVELASLDANVILMARNEKSLNAVLGELDRRKGQKHQFICADFSRPEEVKARITDFVKNNPPVHILVNNTGGPPGGAIAEAETEAFEETFSQHLICNHILAQAVLPGMKKENYGRIINIISTSVKQPLKNLGVSNTVRAAVANWAKTLSVEVAPFGITVNNVLPGATLTGRLNGLIENRSKQTGRSVDVLRREMLAEIPAGRFGEPAEIARAVAFLASPAAAYINGINLPVDGGRTGSL
ncbi:SDR family oxidoreductase [bacterium]|nr:MAG: SDR family oxidoreductase [bacterium]